MTRLHITEVGKQIALSGLLPETADYLLNYVSSHQALLCGMLPDEGHRPGDLDGFNYCLTNACLTSPEFASAFHTRSVPYGFGETTDNEPVKRYAAHLAEVPWQPYRSAANAATLLIDWLEGVDLGALEGTYPGLRAGAIQALCRDLAWCLSGLANILAAATRANLSHDERPACMRELTPQALKNLRRLPASIRLLIRRLVAGLPTPALWLTELETPTGERSVSRAEAIGLHQVGLSALESLCRTSRWQDLVDLLTSMGAAQPKKRAAELQELARAWHGKRRERAFQHQLQRLEAADQPLMTRLYESREKEFEAAVEALMTRAGVRYTLFDTGRRPGAFDYLLHIDGRPDVILECKTKQGENLVDLTAARTVLGSAAQYGHRETFCITLCQPGIDPNVIESLQACTLLCLVETHNFAEALTRLMTNSLTPQAFHDWLTQPGQATSDMLLAYMSPTAETAD
ncbi:restriction endonuclease [Stigmatella hybrida]|uniref:restriction endonuclease n=1 Tax=Stigmatella hybrida TaxID=394097 RepID=UPI001CDA9542|nr:restriction endonuclease [Stigmatella hybrida]